MILHLGNGIFTATAHRIMGPPKYPEVCGEIPEGKWENERKWEWPDDSLYQSTHCGLSHWDITVNGSNWQLWACRSAIDAALNGWGTHGDFYTATIAEMAAAIGEAVELELSDREPKGISEYREHVKSWGFNNSLKNRIPASRFIELARNGRFVGDRSAEEYARALLGSVGRSSGLDPVRKCAKVFEGIEPLSELLRVLVADKERTKHHSAQLYRTWSQQTKSISTTYLSQR